MPSQPATLPDSSSAESPAPVRKAGAIRVYTQPARDSRPIDWAQVESYLPLARSLAARLRIYFPPDTSLDDLSSIALNGLISASVQFCPTKGKSFGKYAELRIRGALLDELRKLDRFTRGQRSRQKQIEAALQTLQLRLRRFPEEAEIAAELGLTLATYRQWIAHCRPIRLLSLDAESAGDSEGSTTLLDNLEDEDATDSFRQAEKSEMIEVLQEQLEKLPTRHQQVVSLYHFQELNLAEIAAVLDLTESRVCQIHSEAILSLRSTLRRLSGGNL